MLKLELKKEKHYSSVGCHNSHTLFFKKLQKVEDIKDTDAPQLHHSQFKVINPESMHFSGDICKHVHY